MSLRVEKLQSLRFLHKTWKDGKLSVTQIQKILLTAESLKLVSLTNGGIKAESLDGTEKYSIK